MTVINFSSPCLSPGVLALIVPAEIATRRTTTTTKALVEATPCPGVATVARRPASTRGRLREPVGLRTFGDRGFRVCEFDVNSSFWMVH